MLCALQDKLALTSEEETAIGLKREFAGGQEHVIWNPILALPPNDFTDVTVSHIRAALQTWNSYVATVDRQWLEPLLHALGPGELR